MAEKVCCPGPIGGNNGNSAGGFREAVCVHTKKVYDSCRSKECLRDIRVYLTRDAQELINAGGIASVKPRAAELLCVSIDVERIQFNRGFYSVDIRFFYRIECEISCVIGRPRIVDGLAVFDKRVVLFGGEGGARIFSSQYIEDGRDVQLRPDSNKPTAVVEVVDPIMLDARVVAPETSCNCCCQSIKCYRFTKRQKSAVNRRRFLIFLSESQSFQPAKSLELLKSAGTASSRLPRAAGTALFASRRGQLRVNRRAFVDIPRLCVLVIANQRRRIYRRAVLGDRQIEVRTGRVAGTADVADRLPLFYFRADRHAALVLHVVVHAFVPVIMRNLNRPSVTGDPAVCGYLATLHRLNRRTGRRGNVNGLVPTRGRGTVACSERVTRTKLA